MSCSVVLLAQPGQTPCPSLLRAPSEIVDEPGLLPGVVLSQEVRKTCLTSHGAKENAEIFFICLVGGMVNEF